MRRQFFYSIFVKKKNNFLKAFLNRYVIDSKLLFLTYFVGCSNTIRLNDGVIVSPGYNKVPYPNSQKCIYSVELPNGKIDQPLAFIINSFDVADDDRFLVHHF